MLKIRRENYISCKLSDNELSQFNYLMERLDKPKSDLIRYALKNLYNELKGWFVIKK